MSEVRSMQHEKIKYIVSAFLLSVILFFCYPVKAEEITENLLSENLSIESQINEEKSSETANVESIGLIDSIENHDDEDTDSSNETEETVNNPTETDETVNNPNETEETVNNPTETDETVNNPSETDETLPDINTEEEIDEIELENANQKTEQNDTTMPKYEVQEKNGKLYLVNIETGEYRKDNAWVEHKGAYYFPNADGVLYRDQIITFGPEIAYYMGEDGSVQKNKVVEYKNNLYLLTGEGKANNSNKWVNFDNKWYFPKTNGVLYSNQKITFGPNLAYYMGSNGYTVSGVYQTAGNLYFYQDKPELKNPEQKTAGWIEYNDNSYFAQAGGQLYKNQIITFGPEIAYYMGEDGSVQKNKVVEYKNNLYLLTDEGKADNSNKWVKFNDKWYFPKTNGVLYSNQKITFGPNLAYYMGSNGYTVSGVYQTAGNLYFYQDNPELKNPEQKTAGWVNHNGNQYYAQTNGVLFTKSIRMINGQEYLFDAYGKATAINTGYQYTVKLTAPWSSQLTPIYAPNGCELASVLGALQYKGYDNGVSLATLLAQMPRHSDPNYGFNTNPYGTALGTIYPQALLPTIQQYAPDAYDMSWSSISDWRNALDAGNPIVLWCTSGFNQPYYGGLSYPSNTHVQLITGYSLTNNTFSLMDPYTWSSSSSLKIVNSNTLYNSNAYGGRYAVCIV